jgi:hypothetical protein
LRKLPRPEDPPRSPLHSLCWPQALKADVSSRGGIRVLPELSSCDRSAALDAPGRPALRLPQEVVVDEALLNSRTSCLDCKKIGRFATHPPTVELPSCTEPISRLG